MLVNSGFILPGKRPLVVSRRTWPGGLAVKLSIEMSRAAAMCHRPGLVLFHLDGFMGRIRRYNAHSTAAAISTNGISQSMEGSAAFDMAFLL